MSFIIRERSRGVAPGLHQTLMTWDPSRSTTDKIIQKYGSSGFLFRSAILPAMFAKHNSAQNWCWSSRSAPISPPLVHSNSESYCLTSTKNKYNNLLSLEACYTGCYWLPYWLLCCSEWNQSSRLVSSIMLQWVLGRVEMTDTETRSLTEMEVGTGGGPAVIDFLHLLSPHLTLTITVWLS